MKQSELYILKQARAILTKYNLTGNNVMVDEKYEDFISQINGNDFMGMTSLDIIIDFHQSRPDTVTDDSEETHDPFEQAKEWLQSQMLFFTRSFFNDTQFDYTDGKLESNTFILDCEPSDNCVWIEFKPYYKTYQSFVKNIDQYTQQFYQLVNTSPYYEPEVLTTDDYTISFSIMID